MVFSLGQPERSSAVSDAYSLDGVEHDGGNEMLEAGEVQRVAREDQGKQWVDGRWRWPALECCSSIVTEERMECSTKTFCNGRRACGSRQASSISCEIWGRGGGLQTILEHGLKCTIVRSLSCV